MPVTRIVEIVCRWGAFFVQLPMDGTRRMLSHASRNRARLCTTRIFFSDASHTCRDVEHTLGLLRRSESAIHIHFL